MEYQYLIAVGSNLGDRYDYIKRALSYLSAQGVQVLKTSRLMETAPVGAADQMFVNGAFVATSTLTPNAMMNLLLKTEELLGRKRDVKWGNRTIDLDILQIRDHQGRDIKIDTEFLQVPHPRMFERDFVMTPAKEIWDFKFTPLSQLWLEQWFGTLPKVYLWLLIGVVVRWLFCWTVPFGNDEAYYWDWGRDVHLSYFDHPPMVAWVSWLGQHIAFFGPATFAGRFFIPIMHLGACLGLLRIYLLLGPEQKPSPAQLVVFLLCVQLVPAFSLGGIMLMPDAGLFLFSSWAVYWTLKFQETRNLKWIQGLCLGILWGLSGLSKYHGFFIAVGALGYFCWLRRSQIAKELSFWVVLIVVGISVVSPVLIWNYQNDWVSFVFQGSRGISGRGVHLVPALRTLLAEVVFLGPILFCGWFLFYQRVKRGDVEINAGEKMIFFSALPLLVLIKVFSVTSQTLPHWSMPSFWLLTPVAMMGLRAQTLRSIPLLKVSVAFGILVCLVIPLLLTTAASRHWICGLLNNRPGALGEMLLWHDVSENQDTMNYITDRSWVTEDELANCGGVTIFAPRWFTVAQIAANFPGHPKVESLDPDHLSYYHFRDQRGPLNRCPVAILSEASHRSALNQNNWIELAEIKEFTLPTLLDRPFVVARAYTSRMPKRHF